MKNISYVCYDAGGEHLLYIFVITYFLQGSFSKGGLVHTHIVIIKKGENVGTYFNDNKCNAYYFLSIRYLLKALITHTQIVLLVDLIIPIVD